MTVRYATGTSSLGVVLVAANAEGICCIALGDTAVDLVREFTAREKYCETINDDPELVSALALVCAFIDGSGSVPALRLSLEGTPFQKRVWEALMAIPAGTTLTYSQLAERIGAPGSSRAVAGACAANKLALVIPCHRVIRSDGSLSGYRWGVERKRALLEREKSITG